MANAEELEGASFEAAFTDLFGSRANVQTRLQREKAAGKSQKQRARKAVRTVQVNVRAAPSTKAMLDALATALGCSAADVFEMAILALAQQHNVTSDADA